MMENSKLVVNVVSKVPNEEVVVEGKNEMKKYRIKQKGMAFRDDQKSEA